MPLRAAVVLVIVAGVLSGTAVLAQTAPGPPGPYVVDLRGATSGVLHSTDSLPPLPEATQVPTRGFGFDLGAHVYGPSLGPARLGFGLNFMRVRATSSTLVAPTSTQTPSTQTPGTVVVAPPDIETLFTTIAPQISFNFGTVDGWSYLSAGAGLASTEATAIPRAAAGEVGTGPETRDSGSVMSINYGGGARWFLGSRLAVGFDIRFHRLSSGRDQSAGVTPGGTLFSASIGISVR